ncbi:metal-sensitive transcriptional regulator [Lentilactobacillus sp. Marseille-Q4993]|uniref:metal-sensitive transcriptional regulator n=1 Tax=Lentilactobacillus sp. Marseille-Q4993 TaxID=3039492 RepID=UPI0024BD4905|nr:metal-sensitive transcriptional regulator [Lentilactobacillus sp. Marseille-Q4993]
MTDKDTISNRLKRAEGQLRGIQKMLTDDSDCMSVITQLSAVRSSVDRTIGIIVADNLKECLEHPTANSAEQSAKIDEAIKLIIKK